MIQEFLAKSPHLFWPIVGLVLFFGAFLGVLGWVAFVLRPGTGRIERTAILPFDDGERTTEIEGRVHP